MEGQPASTPALPTGSERLREASRPLHPDGARARARPDTPLDFLHTMQRRVRSSLDCDRALESSAGDQVAPESAEHPRAIMPAEMEEVAALTTKGRPGTPSRRFGTLRQATRSKLASLGGFGREKSPERWMKSPRRGKHPPSRTSPSIAPPSTSLPAIIPSASDPFITPASSSHSNLSITTPPDHESLSPAIEAYAPSMTSTQSSSSKRDRVMGLAAEAIEAGDGEPGEAKTFVMQKRTDVLPFAADYPFAAWDPVEPSARPRRRPSVAVRHARRDLNEGVVALEEEVFGGKEVEEVVEGQEKEVEEEEEERWIVSPKGKKEWRGQTGVYRVGWERQVLDLEARAHEAMWDVKESHTFASFSPGQEPKTVLDIGTGTGLWPISQALVWPETRFIGLDIVPCQVDLDALVRAERNARSTSAQTAHGEGTWASVQRRVHWERGSFLERLPYDAGVFDMVHMRFCGLGIPETKWGEVLDEARRVLVPGGTLEIVDMAYIPPANSPTSIRNSFASTLLADMVQPIPALPLRFHLPLLAPLYRPVFEQTWTDPVLSEAVMVWVRSALGYKGTGMGREQSGRRVVEKLKALDGRWGCGAEEVEELSEVTVWAWVGQRE